jgi:hypothetical protein
MKRLATVALLVLVGCQSGPQMSAIYATAQPPSPALRVYLAKQASYHVRDVNLVRDAAISSVTTLNAEKHVTLTCLRGNPKNYAGEDLGMYTLSVRMVGDHAVNSFESDPFCSDSRLTWYPFPELKSAKDK